MGGGTTATAALDYAWCEGEEHGPPADPDASKAAREQADKAAELECTAGERQDVEDACARIEESAVVRKGRTAERFLIQQVIELPGDSTPEQRKACAEALVQHWEDRGHPASAAVHARLDGDPKARVQPHVHVQATARPVDADGNVDRSALLWNSKQAVRDEREAVAGIVNEHCPGAVLFHGGCRAGRSTVLRNTSAMRRCRAASRWPTSGGGRGPRPRPPARRPKRSGRRPGARRGARPGPPRSKRRGRTGRPCWQRP